MKKSLFFCVFLYGIGVMSCSNELEVQEKVKALPTVRELVAYPKSDAGRSRSGQLNWEEWEKVTLSSGNHVNTPWNTTQSTTAIPYDIRMDIKSVDGWELIAHTVNGYGDLGVNYLIFHNKYTGVLKVFYYLEPEQANLQNTAMWKLHFEIPQSCLAFSDVYAELSTRKDIYDIYVGNISNDDSKGYTVGWNCFQTELAYDPNLKGGTLQIIPHSCTTSTIELDGDFESTTEGLILSSTTYNKGDKIVKSVAKYAGDKAEKWVEKAIESEKVFKEIKSLIVKGAGSLVSSGVSTLLGAFTGGFDSEKKYRTDRYVADEWKGNSFWRDRNACHRFDTPFHIVSFSRQNRSFGCMEFV